MIQEKVKTYRCTQKHRLENIENAIIEFKEEFKKEIEGNGKEGLHDTTIKNGMSITSLKTSLDNLIRILWIVAIFVGGIMMGNLAWSAVDRYKVLRFPDEYVSKMAMDQWMDELHEQTKLMQKSAKAILEGKLDSALFHNKELEELQKKEALYNQLRATRGGYLPAPTKRDSLYREKIIKEMQERKKQRQ